MNDYLVRSISKEAGIIAQACVTTDLANEGGQRHKTQPTAGALLARGLTGAALLGAMLKVRQRIAIKFEGDGPAGKFVVEANNYGRVRGYVSAPEVELPRQFGVADISAAVGTKGLVTIVKDLGVNDVGEQDLHQGIVEIQDGTVANDLLHYLARSEQVQSLIEIDAVLNDDTSASEQIAAAGGLLVQALPGQKPKILDKLDQRMEELPPFAHQLRDGNTPEEILAEVLAGIDYDILEKRALSFSCYCSWQRTEKALLSLSRDDLLGLMDEGEAVVDCHFCGEQYIFGPEELETIIDKL